MVAFQRDGAPDIAAILASVRAVHRGDHDAYVRLDAMSFAPLHENPGPLHENLGLRCEDVVSGGVIRLRAESLPRVCRYLDMPPSYAESLPASLAASLLNFHLQARGHELALMRLNHGDDLTLRALMSASRVRIDDAAIVEVMGALPGIDALRAAHVSVVEDHFHLRLVHTEPFDVGDRREDLVYPGLDIYNSEVGTGPLRVRLCLVRQICTNGMTISERLDESLRIDPHRLDRDQVAVVLRRAIGAGLESSRRLQDHYRRTHKVRLTDPAGALDAFMRQHRLGSPRGRTGERILGELHRNRDLFGLSVFDFVQAVTSVSQTLDTGRRLEYEDAVGQLMWTQGWRGLVN